MKTATAALLLGESSFDQKLTPRAWPNYRPIAVATRDTLVLARAR